MIATHAYVIIEEPLTVYGAPGMGQNANQKTRTGTGIIILTGYEIVRELIGRSRYFEDNSNTSDASITRGQG